MEGLGRILQLHARYQWKEEGKREGVAEGMDTKGPASKSGNCRQRGPPSEIRGTTESDIHLSAAMNALVRCGAPLFSPSWRQQMDASVAVGATRGKQIHAGSFTSKQLHWTGRVR